MSNILPKKCWHVGRPENKQRVKEDEEKANAAKNILEARQEETIRKSRLEVLRKSAQRASFQNETKEHINLFKSEEDFQNTITSSVDKIPSKSASGSFQMKREDPVWYTERTQILQNPDKREKQPLSEDPAFLFMKSSYFGK